MNSRPLLALVVLLGLGVFTLGCGGAADDPIPSAPSAAPSAAQDELDRVSLTLTGRIRELAERYATPLPKLIYDVEALAARVDEHLKQMGASWT